MTTRDARGRFVSADEAAATRLLEKAVSEAVRILRRGLYGDYGVRRVEADHQWLAARTLKTATHAADLLLSERAS